MKKRIKLYNLDEMNPEWKKFTHKIVKVVLHKLDGTESEIKLTWPRENNWGEDAEIANLHLSDMVDHWTKCWIKIRSYQVFLGSITDQGEESYSIHYPITEIPLNKVYHLESGGWVNPEDVLKKRERQIPDRTQFTHLLPKDDNECGDEVTKFTLEEVAQLAFDASLSNEENLEFYKILLEAKGKAEKKGIDTCSIVFFVRQETGALDYYFNQNNNQEK